MLPSTPLDFTECLHHGSAGILRGTVFVVADCRAETAGRFTGYNHARAGGIRLFGGLVCGFAYRGAPV